MTGPTEYHINQAVKHETMSKHHAEIAKGIRDRMRGAGYASTVMAGEVASHHEFASKVHSDAAKQFRAGAGGTAKAFAKSAKLASERANRKGI